jgi:hypothetical protein
LILLIVDINYYLELNAYLRALLFQILLLNIKFSDPDVVYVIKLKIKIKMLLFNIKNFQGHPYHLVSPSPCTLLTSFGFVDKRILSSLEYNTIRTFSCTSVLCAPNPKEGLDLDDIDEIKETYKTEEEAEEYFTEKKECINTRYSNDINGARDDGVPKNELKF